jgi:hypothetical protein
LTQPALTPTQTAFLLFHTQPPERHQWHFLGTQLRASRAGASATIWHGDLEHLVRLGLMTFGLGCADVHLTQRGAEALHEMEEA